MSQFIIKTQDVVKEKTTLLNTLKDVSVTAKISKGDVDSSKDLMDQQYEKLNCKIVPIDPKTEKFKFLQNYMNKSQGSTHSSHTCIEIFEVSRQGEKERFAKKVGNEQLLWHGSGYFNFGGILSQGLRIAPPEAPSTGYMFGKGVYFADVASKSVGYCRTSASNGFGLMLLCNVALGTTNDLTHSDFNASKLPAGKSSTKGCGNNIPDPKGDIIYEGKSKLATGALIKDTTS